MKGGAASVTVLLAARTALSAGRSAMDVTSLQTWRALLAHTNRQPRALLAREACRPARVRRLPEPSRR